MIGILTLNIAKTFKMVHDIDFNNVIYSFSSTFIGYSFIWKGLYSFWPHGLRSAPHAAILFSIHTFYTAS